MLLDVSGALKNPGEPYPFDREIEVPPTELLDDPVEFHSVRIRGTATGVGESINVVAKITARAESVCASCMGSASLDIETDIDELFARDAGPFDPDQYPLNGSQIDLNPPVEEALILQLPIRFLCSENCKGLCPVCGKNRNVSPCTCQEGGGRLSPFSALEGLLTKDEEV